MPKLVLTATELQNPDVDLVSLVKRGANRIPFRFTKGNTEMGIDLHKIALQLFRKVDTEPSVVAMIAARTAEVPEDLFKALIGDGAPVTKSEDAHSVTFAKADIDAREHETLVIKVNDEVALVVKADAEFVKSLQTYDWDSTSFAEVMSKGAFTPSVCMAQEMLQRTFFNIMEKADDGPELAKLMKAAIGEFGAYVDSLCKGLPKSVFKAEAMLAKGAWKTPGVKTPEREVEASTRGTGDDLVEKSVDSAPATADNATPPTPDQESGAKTSDPGMEETVKDDTPSQLSPPDAVAVAIAALSKTISDGLAGVMQHVDQSIAAIKADVNEVSARVGQVADMARKTDEALNGVVLGDPEGDKTGLAKADGSACNGVPLLDTAFMSVDKEFPVDRKAAH